MILQALCQLAQQEGLVDDPDYEWKPVAWIIRLGPGGEYLGLVGTHSVTPAKPGKKPARPLGRVTSVREPGGGVTSYSYDIFSNLTGLTVSGQSNSNCPSGQFRCFTYNALGWLLAATNSENNTVTYNTYDNNGNVTKFTDAQNVVTQMTYDALNRMTSKTHTVPNGSTTTSTSSVTYTYDSDYRGALSSACVLSCTPGAGTIIDTYTHDGFGRVQTSAEQIGSNTPYSFSYQYSLTDQLTAVKYPSSDAFPQGHWINYTLDAADRVNSVQDTTSTTTFATLNYQTDPGNTLSIALGNGATESPSFNDRLGTDRCTGRLVRREFVDARFLAMSRRRHSMRDGVHQRQLSCEFRWEQRQSVVAKHHYSRIYGNAKLHVQLSKSAYGRE